MFSVARTLIASSTESSGATFTIARAGLALSSSATVFMRGSSHVRIVRSAPALGNDPLDVLLRVLDVAGLAVHAVLGVYLEPRRAAFGYELVHPSRTVARLGPVVNGQVDRYRNPGIAKPQVRRLILLVIGIRHEHRRQPVEGEHPVGLWIRDRAHGGLRRERLVVGVLVGEGPRRLATEDDLVYSDHERARVEARRHVGLEVARAV